MTINSRSKGQRGERDIVKHLQECADAVNYPLVIERNLQQSINGGADIDCIPHLSIEVKNCVTLQINQWWEQCQRQAGRKRPILIYKSSRGKWLVMTFLTLGLPNHRYIPATISFDDFKEWLKEFLLTLL